MENQITKLELEELGCEVEEVNVSEADVEKMVEEIVTEKPKKAKKMKKVIKEEMQGLDRENRYKPNGEITKDTFFSIDNMTTIAIEDYLELFGVHSLKKLRKELNVKKATIINYFFKVIKVKYASKGATKRLVTVSAHIANVENCSKDFETIVKDLSVLNSDYRQLSNKQYREKYYN